MKDDQIIHGLFNGAGLCPFLMLKRKPSFFAACAAVMAATMALSAHAQQSRRDEQDGVREQMRKGSIQSLRQIEQNVVPAMKRRGADYIGAEFDGGLLRYRLKFVRMSSVIWIDVDGRSGQIIAQAGN